MTRSSLWPANDFASRKSIDSPLIGIMTAGAQRRANAMSLAIRRIQVWSGEIPDRPGAAAAKLEQLARAGADLEFVFTRPHRTQPETSVLFIAPINGAEQM